MVSDEEHAGGRLIVATETAYSEAKINLNCAYMTQLNWFDIANIIILLFLEQLSYIDEVE